MENRYDLEIQHLQHQAQSMETRHTVEIEHLQQQGQTTEARLTQQVQTSRLDHSCKRLKWFETLGAANDKAQQATTRLDSCLLVTGRNLDE